MNFVGLDLAWSARNRSGIAVLDSRGALIHLGVGHDDDHIVAVLRPFADECVVAVDAPLIVTNVSGRRRAEAELSADFGPFQAGPYPANTTLPVFAAGLRGARIADVLGLDMDPSSPAPRRAIEVYPHSATIALFRLGRTLKYKGGRGRSIADRKAALLRLMALIEGLAEATPPLSTSPQWADLRDTVEAAARPYQLDRAEDPVDAVLCAYVAMYAHRRPHDVVTYGDAGTGYIVTPRLPTDLTPEPLRRTRIHGGDPAGFRP